MSLSAQNDQPTSRFGAAILSFVWAELLSCTFAFGVIGLLLLSKIWPLHLWGLARYDFLLLGCLLLQAFLLWIRFETWREVLVILAFHALGFALEAFKVAHGSWVYPEDALTKVLNVPLYAGFMYASVGSYMTQAWRRLDLQLRHAPPLRWQMGLAGAAYLNFFWHHYGPDFRYIISAAILLAYWRTTVLFRVSTTPVQQVKLALPVAFAGIGLFVFFAENVATRLGAWVYPHQAQAWHLVHPSKILSWTLMVVVAFLIVSSLKSWEERLGQRKAAQKHGKA